jgi:hypothetical protein
MKRAVFIWAAALFLIQGCASDRAYVKNNSVALSPLKVIRHETPGILRSTMAETFFLTAATVGLPGGSLLIVLGDEYSKARGQDMQMKIPDFGNLVVKKFAEKLNRDVIEEGCVLNLEDKPVGEDFMPLCTVMEFKVGRLAYGYLDFVRGSGSNGFLSKTTVTMKDQTGEVLWQRSFTYLSKDYGRDREIDEFEAEEGRLLKEEIEFAAEKTAADFVGHLNGNEKDELAKIN